MAAPNMALFGSPLVTDPDGAAILLRSRKQLALLSFLAVEHRREHSRDSLLALLWPDTPPDAARNNLRVALAELRRLLGPSAACLRAGRHTVCFILDSDSALDVARFSGLVDAWRRHAHAPGAVCFTCLPWLAEAVDLYNGEFMAGFGLPDAAAWDEWAAVRRAQLHQQALEALVALAARNERDGDYAALCRYARRRLALEPWNEDAHRQLMRGLALGGDRARALAQYEICARVLEAELGLEPEADTRALFERLRTGEPLPAHHAVPHNLPAQLTPFVGRERELAELSEQLSRSEARLTTLVGPGGMGKTRLALEAARACLDAFADGICFVALASLADPDELVPTVASALGINVPGGDMHQALRQFVASRQLLLVLDNFEHLLPLAAGHQAAAGGALVELLRSAPRLRIVVTSRAALRLQGEHLYIVDGLPFSGHTTPQGAEQLAAVRLFTQRARGINGAFRLGEANLAAVLRICELVAGMPLGLELAAAWSALLEPSEIAAEIEKSIDFLADEWHAAPARQRSMRAVFDWSWRLLSEAEHQLMRQLAVFRGGCTREAAEAVTGATLRTLDSVVQKSLLRRVGAGQPGLVRYAMHEMLRQFAAEHLGADAEQWAAVATRHSSWYLRYVALRERRIARDEVPQAMAEIQAELDNIRQAWLWAAGHNQIAELDGSAYGLFLFYRLSGPAAESDGALALAAARLEAIEEGALPAAQAHAGRRLLAKLLALRGSVCMLQGKHKEALALAEHAIECGQLSGGHDGEARGLLVKGQALRRLGRSQEASSCLEHAASAARRYRESGVPGELLADTEWLAYNWLCSIALGEDEYAVARQYIERGSQICQAQNRTIGKLVFNTDRADIALATGDYDTAIEQTEAGLRLAHTLGYSTMEGRLQRCLSELRCLRGEYGPALGLATQALAISRANGELLGIALSAGDIGYLRLLMGDYAGAQEWLDRWLETLHATDMPAREARTGWLRLALLAHATGAHTRALEYAERGSEMAQQLDGRSEQAFALCVLGLARVGMDRLDDAASAYEQALLFFTELGQQPKTVEPRAGLAHIALARGDLRLAREHVHAILAVQVTHRNTGFHDPFPIFLTCYRILEAAADPRVTSVLATALQRVSEYAAGIGDDVLRGSFMERAPIRELVEASTRAGVLYTASAA